MVSSSLYRYKLLNIDKDFSLMGRAAKGWAAMGQAGTGRERMGQVGTGQAEMGRLETGRSGTGRSRKKLQRTFLLLTGYTFDLVSSQSVGLKSYRQAETLLALKLDDLKNKGIT
jgi:hypothetical protein